MIAELLLGICLIMYNSGEKTGTTIRTDTGTTIRTDHTDYDRKYNLKSIF